MAYNVLAESGACRSRARFSALFSMVVCTLACSGSTSDAADGSAGAGGSSAAAGKGGTGAAGADSGGTSGATSGNGGIGGQDSGVDSGGPCGPDPSGCVGTGCPQGKACDPSQGCRPSACSCDPSTGKWACTEDCNGGTCVDSECVGCPPEMPLFDSSCAGYPEGTRCTYAQQTRRCEWYTGGTSSGRHSVTCRSNDGSLTWN